MKSQRARVLSVGGVVFVMTLGVLTLTATPETPAAGCEPVVCPAIIKICPQGQVACRVSPCNCALVCARGCNNEESEPLNLDGGTLDREGGLAQANANLMTPAERAGVNGQFCGGVAEIPCPEGFVCVPVEGCDPLIDSCPGRCRRNR